MPLVEVEVSRVFNFCSVKAKVTDEVETVGAVQEKYRELHAIVSNEVDIGIRQLKNTLAYEELKEAQAALVQKQKKTMFEVPKGENSKADPEVVEDIEAGNFYDYPLFADRTADRAQNVELKRVGAIVSALEKA